MSFREQLQSNTLFFRRQERKIRRDKQAEESAEINSIIARKMAPVYEPLSIDRAAAEKLSPEATTADFAIALLGGEEAIETVRNRLYATQETAPKEALIEQLNNHVGIGR